MSSLVFGAAEEAASSRRFHAGVRMCGRKKSGAESAFVDSTSLGLWVDICCFDVGVIVVRRRGESDCSTYVVCPLSPECLADITQSDGLFETDLDTYLTTSILLHDY